MIHLLPFLAILPFLIVGVLLALHGHRRIDVHVYHHEVEQGPQRPAVAPRTARYRVVDADTDVMDRIEDHLSAIVAVTREWQP